MVTLPERSAVAVADAHPWGIQVPRVRVRVLAEDLFQHSSCYAATLAVATALRSVGRLDAGTGWWAWVCGLRRDGIAVGWGTVVGVVDSGGLCRQCACCVRAAGAPGVRRGRTVWRGMCVVWLGWVCRSVPLGFLGVEIHVEPLLFESVE